MAEYEAILERVRVLLAKAASTEVPGQRRRTVETDG